MQNFIDKQAQISGKAKIHPFVVVLGKSVIEEGAEIYPFSVIENSVISAGSKIYSSHIEDSFVGQNCEIGPNAHLRQHAHIENNVRIGNFVEIKKSVVGQGSKAAHLAYIGDAEVGQECNIGCGVVFCNFDGKQKHKTKLGNDVFVGSNANLVAPIEIGDNCFVAAGSTVTKNLEENSFCIERSELKIKPRRENK